MRAQTGNSLEFAEIVGIRHVDGDEHGQRFGSVVQTHFELGGDAETAARSPQAESQVSFVLRMRND